MPGVNLQVTWKFWFQIGDVLFESPDQNFRKVTVFIKTYPLFLEASYQERKTDASRNRYVITFLSSNGGRVDRQERRSFGHVLNGKEKFFLEVTYVLQRTVRR